MEIKLISCLCKTFKRDFLLNQAERLPKDEMTFIRKIDINGNCQSSQLSEKNKESNFLLHFNLHYRNLRWMRKFFSWELLYSVRQKGRLRMSLIPMTIITIVHPTLIFSLYAIQAKGFIYDFSSVSIFFIRSTFFNTLFFCSFLSRHVWYFSEFVLLRIIQIMLKDS